MAGLWPAVSGGFTARLRGPGVEVGLRGALAGPLGSASWLGWGWPKWDFVYKLGFGLPTFIGNEEAARREFELF